MEVEFLLNYGVLGVWTGSLLWEKKTFSAQMKQLAVSVDKNTEVLDLLLLKVTNKRREKK